MDEENHPTSRSPSNGAPTRMSGVQRPADSGSSSTVVYDGDAARVSEGFALALKLLGLNVPMVDVVARDQAEDGE